VSVYIVAAIACLSPNKQENVSMEERNNNKNREEKKSIWHIILSNCSNLISEW